ncbi:MAG: CpsD/CapB family tyrosine-protein kinase [Pirellulaceae bacterium]
MLRSTSMLGLTDVLGGLEEPWDAVESTSCPGLSVLPCGRVPANPSELLNSDAFASFIDLAKDKYDVILIDCPAVLSVSDPLIVASMADVCILQLRIVNNGRPSAVNACELLRSTGIEMLGVAVLGAEQTRPTSPAGMITWDTDTTPTGMAADATSPTWLNRKRESSVPRMHESTRRCQRCVANDLSRTRLIARASKRKQPTPSTRQRAMYSDHRTILGLPHDQRNSVGRSPGRHRTF